MKKAGQYNTKVRYDSKLTNDTSPFVSQEGTTKVIFALNEKDPASANDVMKHTFKGIRSVLLLNSQGNRIKPDPSWKYFDVLNRNVSTINRLWCDGH